MSILGLSWRHLLLAAGALVLFLIVGCTSPLPPLIEDQEFTVDEHAPNGAVVGTVVFFDLNLHSIGDELRVTVTGGTGYTAFTVGPNGLISVADSSQLDFKTVPSLTLDIRVTDPTGLFDSATVTVYLKKAGENRPPLMEDQEFSIEENSPNGTVVGTLVATDPDPGDEVSIEITGGTGASAFAVDVSGAITVADSRQLDHEAAESLMLWAMATDVSGLSDAATITVLIDDVPEGLASMAFGNNLGGQLSDGTTTNQRIPIASVEQFATYVTGDAGEFHTCGVRPDGTLWCWGRNTHGQIGDGTNIDRDRPVQIGSESWLAVATGQLHTCAIKADDNSLWCWGSNSAGQVGDGTTQSRNRPVLVAEDAGPPGGSLPSTSITAGHAHTCAILEGGLWCWGSNSNGQLGDGTTTDRLVPTALTHVWDGTSWRELAPPDTWKNVSAGGSHTCGVVGLPAPTSACWGKNSYGQLGNGTLTDTVRPGRVRWLEPGPFWNTEGDFDFLAAGREHTCGSVKQVFTNEAELWCWGFNGSGQLGDETTTDRSTPVEIDGPSDITGGWKYFGFDAGAHHTCAIRERNGWVYCWGSGFAGQLGTGTTEQIDDSYGGGRFPVGWDHEQYGTAVLAEYVIAGGHNTCSIGSPRHRYCWGLNDWGQLGDGTRERRLLPKGESPWELVNIDAGTDHTCGVTESGSLYCVGDNSFGKLGDGTTSSATSPTRVGADSNWTQVSAGMSHSCGIRRDGTLWCWGLNNLGQLGNPETSSDHFIPARVGVDSNWMAVSAAGYHTCGIQEDGTLWCWGYNNDGQLGDGTNTSRWMPARIWGPQPTWKSVSAGSSTTCAVSTEGSASCWGNNAYGQLGDGSTTHRTIPTSVKGRWNEVDTSGVHTCGIRDDGTPWCWGLNNFGQLGDGTTSNRVDPTRPYVGGSWSTVSTGRAHTCGLMSDNAAWCWGRNESGQLGDDSSDDWSSPRLVHGDHSWGSISSGGSHTSGLKLKSANDGGN